MRLLSQSRGDDDPLNAARGCINAIVLSVPIWIVIGLVICFA